MYFDDTKNTPPICCAILHRKKHSNDLTKTQSSEKKHCLKVNRGNKPHLICYFLAQSGPLDRFTCSNFVQDYHSDGGVAEQTSCIQQETGNWTPSCLHCRLKYLTPFVGQMPLPSWQPHAPMFGCRLASPEQEQLPDGRPFSRCVQLHPWLQLYNYIVHQGVKFQVVTSGVTQRYRMGCSTNTKINYRKYR